MDNIKKNFYADIKEKRMNFYRPPTKKINLNEKGGKGIKTEIINIDILKQKPKEQQKAIVLELQNIYGNDRKIWEYLKTTSSSVCRLRKRLDIPAVNPQKSHSQKMGNTDKKHDNQKSALNIEFKIEGQSLVELTNNFYYLIKALNPYRLYNFSFKINEYQNQSIKEDP